MGWLACWRLGAVSPGMDRKGRKILTSIRLAFYYPDTRREREKEGQLKKSFRPSVSIHHGMQVTKLALRRSEAVARTQKALYAVHTAPLLARFGRDRAQNSAAEARRGE